MSGGVTREQFLDYFDSFQRGDFEEFSKYYHEDVVFTLAGGKLVMHGRQAIVDFYKDVLARIREDLEIGFLIVGEAGIAAEVTTTFTALKDYPDFIVKPLKKGEQVRTTSFAHYDVKDGKFTAIRACRYGEPVTP